MSISPTAYPNAHQATVLRNSMDLKLIDSFLYLINQAELALNTDYKKTKNYLISLRLKIENSNLKLRGTFYAIHNQLLVAMKNGQVNNVKKIINQLDGIECISKDLEIVNLNSPSFSCFELESFIETVSVDYNSTYSRQFDASSTEEHEFLKMYKIVKSILHKIKEEDVETFYEIKSLLSHIVIIRSEHINAGTCFKAFGLVYLTALRMNQDWTVYLENIVHEAAHHLLFSFWTIDSIIKQDGGRLYKSPLRTEPRPMSGIYHAMFVLARTIRILYIFRSNPNYKDDINRMTTGYNQAKNTASLEEKFFETCSTIKKNARLTKVGNEILEECIELVNRFKYH